MKLKKAKCFTAGILILALCGQALGADVSGPAVLAAPMPSNAGPYSINAPTLSPAMPTVPNSGTGGVNLTGLDPTSPTSRTENIDATTGTGQTTNQQQTDSTGLNINGTNLTDADTPITEEEVNEYLKMNPGDHSNVIQVTKHLRLFFIMFSLIVH